MFIPLNTAAYTPNTLNSGSPAQANQTTGRGFFTAPNRSASGKLIRAVSSTFSDVWSQPRLFFNSLLPAEQQFVVNAIRFETSNIQSKIVKNNVLIQLNRISHDIAVRVAEALGMTAPPPDPTFYNNNVTTGVSVFKNKLLRLDGLKVGFLTSVTAAGTASPSYNSSLSTLQASFASVGVDLVVVAESLVPGVNQTYSATDASNFDGIIVSDGTAGLFTANANSSTSTLYPAGRPLQILVSGYRWGKPVGAIGSGSQAFTAAGIPTGTPGVFTVPAGGNIASVFDDALRTFKFLDRFKLDH